MMYYQISFLFILDMSEDFRALPPASTQGILGSGIELTCTPPEGIPEPVVRWKKNGEFVDFASSNQRISISYNGHLRISSLRKSDEGKYQCAASNMAAVRDSRPVRLHILRKFSNIYNVKRGIMMKYFLRIFRIFKNKHNNICTIDYISTKLNLI